ncbi:MAG: hypothetical protein HGA78_03720, partial [Nitrospirales bacterium]|nr:hypothetical protein [Nitrospirales bacterium]
LSVETLCNVLEEDNYGFRLTSTARRIAWLKIDWLNSLLMQPTLYDEIIQKKDTNILDELTRNTIDTLNKRLSSVFSMLEFKDMLSVKKLCKALENDNNRMVLPSEADPIEWLNEQIEKPGLYDKLCQKKAINTFSEFFKMSITTLRTKYEQSRSIEDLRRWNRYVLEVFYPDETPPCFKILNRYLLEVFYTQATPKIQDRLSTERLRRAIEKDNPELSGSATAKAIDWLNKLIESDGLYDKITQQKGLNDLNKGLINTIGELKKEYDQSVTEEEKTEDLKKLNRYLLEAFYPEETPMSYQSWRGYKHMPELNLENEELQGFLFRNKNSVLQKYLSMEVDGFRFDAANDLGRRAIRNIREALKDKFPHAVFIGEVTNYGGDWIDKENKYHGVMNYYFHGALTAWVFGCISSLQMNYMVDEYYKGYGEEGARCSWNILSSHDTPRLKTMLDKDDKARELAVVAQFTLPGVPFIYYGEEIGMEGGPDPDCRRPMVWEEEKWDKKTWNFYKALITIRKSRRELREGKCVMLSHKMMPNFIMKPGCECEADVLAFLRYTEKINQISLVVLNRSQSYFIGKLFIPHSHLYDGLHLKDKLQEELNSLSLKDKPPQGSPHQTPFHVHEMKTGGGIDLTIPGRSAVILVTDDTQYRDYKFYKPRNLGE